MRNATLCFAFLVSITAYTQIDSLKYQLEKREVIDSAKIMMMLDLGYAYEFQYPDSALIVYKEVIALSDEIGFQFGKGKALQYIGIVHSDAGNYSQAIKYYTKAIEVFDHISNKRGAGRTYLNIGNVYNQQGLFDKSLTNYHKSFDILHTLEDSSAMVILLTNIGTVHQTMGDLDEALKFQKQSLTISKLLHDQNVEARSSLNLGNTFLEKNELDSAKKYYNHTYVLSKPIENYEFIYLALNNLASVDIANGQINSALDKMSQALQYAEHSGNPIFISDSWMSVGITHLEAKKYDSAFYYLNKTLEFNTDIDNRKNLALIYAKLSQVSEEQGNYVSALEQHKISAAFYDSLSNVDMIKEVGRIEAKHNLERQIEEEQRLENERRKSELAKESRMRMIQYSIIALVVIALVVLTLAIGKIQISDKASNLLVLGTALLIFEFLLLIFDPFVDKLSAGIPVIKLALNSLIALVIIPLHGILIKVLKKQ